MFQITVMTSSPHSNSEKAILITDRNIYKRKNETATYKTAKCHKVPSDSKGCSRIKGMRPSNLRFFVRSITQSHDKTSEPLPRNRPLCFPSTSFPIHRHSQIS